MKKAALIIVLVFAAGLVLSSCRSGRGCPGMYSDEAPTEQSPDNA